jgi:MOSC domain-containing protein YiiM
VSEKGLEGDSQADAVNHGGAAKAVHIYLADDYRALRALGAGNVDFHGALGENLTVEGITKEEICIGDRFSSGELIMQVTRPRNPCKKLDALHKDLMELFTSTNRRGFYLKVINPGFIKAGDRLIHEVRGAIPVCEAKKEEYLL